MGVQRDYHVPPITGPELLEATSLASAVLQEIGVVSEGAFGGRTP